MKRVAVISIITLLLVHYNQLVAQDFTIGVGGGLNIPSLLGGGSDNPLKTGNSFKFGNDCEVFGVYPISKTFSCSLGIDYSQEGGLYKLNYLLVPFLVRHNWSISPQTNFYLGAGPFGGFLLNANRSISPGALKNPNTFNSGIEVVAGISRQISHFGAIFLELGSDYGCIRIQKPPTHTTGHLFMDTVRIGYSFTFNTNYASPSNKRFQKILYKTEMQ